MITPQIHDDHGSAAVDFLDGSAEADDALRRAAAAVVEAVLSSRPGPPFPAIAPEQLKAQIDAVDPLPDEGAPLDEVLAQVTRDVLANDAKPAQPWCAAHLHSPTLLTAAATELAIGVTNQSMDSFDQAPAATYAEDRLVRSLAGLLGLPDGEEPEIGGPGSTGGGVLTSGGTSSNLLGLLLARDRAAVRSGRSEGSAGTGRTEGSGGSGLPADAASWRVLASDAAHVSIRQACAVLGLGRDAVVPVTTDDAGRMRADALDQTLDEVERTGGRVIAIVGTAGTTDSGSVDPLDVLADRAARCGAWLHVDAAVGAGLALSERLRPMLDGIQHADSITADLHKLWWQPIGASALLVRDIGTLHGFREPAAYLNRQEDTGVLNLVDRSLDTSRRFDALKVLVSLRATGRRRLSRYVEHIVGLAADAARYIASHPDLQLVADPQTVTVLFRCRPARTGSAGHHLTGLDRLNTDVQRTLLARGQAVVGRTRWRGQVVLKLTLVNPLTGIDDVTGLLDLIAATARSMAGEHTARAHTVHELAAGEDGPVEHADSGMSTRAGSATRVIGGH
ncbi:pyridoxal phosphate-dependent decarboxylase family protein [Phytoactinopolyspora halotolerans]|uniref:Aspartate aminotransferase family protein n=1 Tax=Phytoactinopolyspora halotolerans TaxID=1981512 RepID=A0A6L9SF82_9ACTN|nr:pyridoxal-dependent decarboxylase [Phytoactinopolyspora halotolerans]NEE03866.1 aspartate aminotransferase family protein [Phytoactinopolyspora halotolerans]